MTVLKKKVTKKVAKKVTKKVTKKVAKKVTKKVTKKVAKKVAEVETPVKKEVNLEYMTTDELSKLQQSGHNMTQSKLQMALQEQYLKNQMLELELLKVKIEKEGIVRDGKAAAYDAASKNCTLMVQQLKAKYKVTSEGFGYDPTSGKIIR